MIAIDVIEPFEEKEIFEDIWSPVKESFARP